MRYTSKPIMILAVLALHLPGCSGDAGGSDPAELGGATSTGTGTGGTPQASVGGTFSSSASKGGNSSSSAPVQSGGGPSTGGPSSGGSLVAGGTATGGGSISSNTIGGKATGGSGQGGNATGSNAIGGAATGGASGGTTTGGKSAGGAGIGGATTGGAATGGKSAGGAGIGGTGIGGAATGGAGIGGSANGGTTSGGNASSCSVNPVDPDATPQAKKLLCYLYSIYKKSVLSGQQETSWNSDPAGDVKYYNNLLAKYPAVLGGDYLYPTGTTSRAQAWWDAGGIAMLRYHMGAPPNSDTYDNSKLGFTSTQCSNVVTSGTSENKSLLSKLDYLAKELEVLQTANVPVILALYHETQANGWFWWSKCSGSQFIQLYTLTYDYLMKTKGIHNIVRLMPFSGTPSVSYYPGKALVDIGGPDEYLEATSQPFAALYSTSSGILGTTMPIALHETGTIPQPDQMFPSAAPWLLWNVWASYYSGTHDGRSGPYNTDASIKTAYASTYTITRDEVPNLK